MKRSLFIVVGALLFAALGFLVGSVVTNWYADHFAKSDDDIGQSVGYFLFIWPLFAVLGGYIGNRVFRKRSPGL